MSGEMKLFSTFTSQIYLDNLSTDAGKLGLEATVEKTGMVDCRECRYLIAKDKMIV